MRTFVFGEISLSLADALRPLSFVAAQAGMPVLSRGSPLVWVGAMLAGGAATGAVMVVRAGGGSTSAPLLLYRLSKAARGQDEGAKQSV